MIIVPIAISFGLMHEMSHFVTALGYKPKVKFKKELLVYVETEKEITSYRRFLFFISGNLFPLLFGIILNIFMPLNPLSIYYILMGSTGLIITPDTSQALGRDLMVTKREILLTLVIYILICIITIMCIKFI